MLMVGIVNQATLLPVLTKRRIQLQHRDWRKKKTEKKCSKVNSMIIGKLLTSAKWSHSGTNCKALVTKGQAFFSSEPCSHTF